MTRWMSEAVQKMALSVPPNSRLILFVVNGQPGCRLAAGFPLLCAILLSSMAEGRTR